MVGAGTDCWTVTSRAHRLETTPKRRLALLIGLAAVGLTALVGCQRDESSSRHHELELLNSRRAEATPNRPLDPPQALTNAPAHPTVPTPAPPRRGRFRNRSAPNTGAIEGTVVAADTLRPLSGARVWLERDEPGVFSPGPEQQPSAVSDADGSFEISDISAGSYRVRVLFATDSIPEWVAEPVPILVDSRQTTGGVQVRAVRGGLLEVALLRHEDRRPVADVNVSVRGERSQAVRASGTNGLVQLRLPAGTYQVSAYRNRWRTLTLSEKVRTGETNRVELEVSPPARIIGTVRQPDGQPAAGLEVQIVTSRAREGDVHPTTDAAGHFELDWDPRRDGRGEMRSSVLVRDPVHGWAALGEVGQDSGPLELQLAPALTLAGQVKDATGQSASDFVLKLLFRGGNAGIALPSLKARVDSSGRFEFSALPKDGTYGLNVSAPGYGTVTLDEIATEPVAGRIDLEPIQLKLANLRVAGQVVDTQDQPVAGALVSLQSEGQTKGSARTDAQGRFGFEGICAGAVQLRANARDGSGSGSAAGGDTNVILRLEAIDRSTTVTLARPTGRVGSGSNCQPLLGSPLPDPALVGLSSNTIPAGQLGLVCLLDGEQRPSRGVLRQMAGQHEGFKAKGLHLAAVQVVVLGDEAWRAFRENNAAPFPVGRVTEKAVESRWTRVSDSLPWLILVDLDGRVAAEGFSLDDLDAKLQGLKK